MFTETPPALYRVHPFNGMHLQHWSWTRNRVSLWEVEAYFANEENDLRGKRLDNQEP